MKTSAAGISSDAGGSLVELAVALPLLVLIIAGTVDFARVFNLSVNLTNAARAGAQYGAQNIAQSGDEATMETTAEAAVNVAGVNADAERLCQCSTAAGVFSSTSPVNNCTATCSSGGHMVITVTVTASKTFTTIMNIIPGVPSSIPLSRAATLRVPN